ncbi:hypothetical protein ACFE04_011759 [Oxalis oulophora]
MVAAQGGCLLKLARWWACFAGFKLISTTTKKTDFYVKRVPEPGFGFDGQERGKPGTTRDVVWRSSGEGVWMVVTAASFDGGRWTAKGMWWRLQGVLAAGFSGGGDVAEVIGGGDSVMVGDGGVG